MFLTLTFTLACVADLQDPARESAAPATERVMEEGSREALGVLAFVNDAATTLTVLDVDAALDSRAAKSILAHRDGADGLAGTKDDNAFDSVQELDDVKYVGDSALAALLAYATAHGWVPASEDYYGTVETVSFTYAEAEGVVALANTASEAELDEDAGLDSRAAKALVAGRPFTDVEAVAAAKYVGPTALTALKAYVNAPPLLDAAEAVAALNTDVSGLLFSSESDYPLVVWEIAAPSTTALTSGNVKTILAPVYEARSGSAALSARTVEKSSMSWAFDRYTVEQSWWEDSNRASAPAWRTLRAVFDDQLTDVTVWRLGTRDSGGTLSGDIDVFVVGVTADGALVGFRTVSIET
jgi:DNA uptake protein ComE-like DNA-binding protein